MASISNHNLENCPSGSLADDQFCNEHHLDTTSIIKKRGTESSNKNLPPHEMVYREWLFGLWNTISAKHNFRKYDISIIDNDQLSNEKCIVQSLAELAIASTETVPLKWFGEVSKRDGSKIYQWNADIIGGADVKSEVEILSLIISFFESIKLSPRDVDIKFSHGGLLTSLFDAIGIDIANIDRAFNIVDQFEKLTPQQFKHLLCTELKINNDDYGIIVDAINAKSISDLFNININSTLWQASVKNISDIYELVDAYGYQMTIDCKLIGHRYCDGIIFQAFHKPSYTTFIRGGRYHQAIPHHTPLRKFTAVGCWFEDQAMMDVLKQLDKLPHLDRHVEYCVASLDQSLYPQATRIAKFLRNSQKNVDLCFELSMENIIKYANEIGASNIVMVSSQEWERGKIILKCLTPVSKQIVCTIADILDI